jgi:predicted transcriptional regulator
MTKSNFTVPVENDLNTLSNYDAWFRSQVQAGLDSANAGRLIASDEIEAEFAARRQATRNSYSI